MIDYLPCLVDESTHALAYMVLCYYAPYGDPESLHNHGENMEMHCQEVLMMPRCSYNNLL